MPLQGCHWPFVLLLITLRGDYAVAHQATTTSFEAVRFASNPIIHAGIPELQALGEDGKNINGPALLKVPKWVTGRLGRYYLYFASHVGKFIRMAHADELTGPWTVRPGGVLQLSQVGICREHIASPDVVLEDGTIWLFFHCIVQQRGPIPLEWDSRSQCTAAAASTDGLTFTSPSPHHFLGPFYYRVFRYEGHVYALAKRRGPGGGVVYRCPQSSVKACANVPFQRGPQVIAGMRHAAVLVVNTTLMVFFSRVGDAPESIYFNTFDLRPDWTQWGQKVGPDVLVLQPEKRYEGAHLPVTASPSGPSKGEARQLRDPAIYAEGGDLYLFYSVAGEHGIAAARLRSGPGAGLGPSPAEDGALRTGPGAGSVAESPARSAAALAVSEAPGGRVPAEQSAVDHPRDVADDPPAASPELPRETSSRPIESSAEVGSWVQSPMGMTVLMIMATFGTLGLCFRKK